MKMIEPKITWLHPYTFELFNLIPTKTRSLIDVGCGRGVIGALMRIYREPKRLVGIDIFEPYLEFCKKFNLYDEIYALNLRKLPLPFKNNEFEVATCVEVLEHLPKKNGKELLCELERIANMVISSTPNWDFPQQSFDGNIFQQHKSRWSRSDFNNIGYDTIRVGHLTLHQIHIRFLISKIVASPFPFSDYTLAKKLVRNKAIKLEDKTQT